MINQDSIADHHASRTIGMDIHPRLFSAACLAGNKATNARQLWLHDAKPVDQLETWGKKHLKKGDVVVLEAGSNTFEICGLLKDMGASPVVLESVGASRVSKGYLKNDKVDAVKLAKVYLSGLCSR